MYTVVDVETTGLYPGRHDRVIEVGIVRLDDSFEIVEEWGTLVDPGRDVGPTRIHGIQARDLIGAPRWDDIVGDVLYAMRGRWAVGHNVAFDLRFLDAECRRAGIEFGVVPSICTMRMLGGRLEACCQTYGVELSDAHSALGDARATAELLRALALEDPDAMTRPPDIAAAWTAWERYTPTGARHLRSDAARRKVDQETWLPRLVQSLPVRAGMTDGDAVNAYLDVLDRVLEDRRIDEIEQQGIVSLAADWGLSADDAGAAHERYVELLVGQAWADGVITDLERADIDQVARMLGIDSAKVEELMGSDVSASTPSQSGDCELAGLSVCFTGQLSVSIDGALMTRSLAQEIAADAGLMILGGVSKKLDVLVLADPDSQSAKAKKARSYGTRLMSEAVFFGKLGVAVG